MCDAVLASAENEARDIEVDLSDAFAGANRAIGRVSRIQDETHIGPPAAQCGPGGWRAEATTERREGLARGA